MAGLVDSRPGNRGSRYARDLLRYLLPGSKSGAESILVLQLILRPDTGGFSIAKPALNQAIRISAAHQRILRKGFLVPDLLWREQRLVVEYDSREWHDDYARREEDTLKGNVYQDLGYDYLCITKSQMENIGVFLVQIQAIARKLGAPLPEQIDEEHLAAFYRLRMELSPDWLGACDALARSVDFPHGLT
ncbi:MAG: hypothetical protein IJJ14_03870 [Coriobacteriales bacterium]|nr:hypothetical protein [Coriobacteriales bacterium]